MYFGAVSSDVNRLPTQELLFFRRGVADVCPGSLRKCVHQAGLSGEPVDHVVKDFIPFIDSDFHGKLLLKQTLDLVVELVEELFGEPKKAKCSQDDGGIHAEAITSHVVEDHENVEEGVKLGAEKGAKMLHDVVQGALLGFVVGPLGGIGCEGGQALQKEVLKSIV